MNPLRNIPSVNELLESPPLRALVDRISHSAVVSTVRTVLEEVRSEVQSAAVERTLPSVTELAERIARRVMETETSSLRPVINATGALWGAGLGRAPLAEDAVEEMAAVARDYAGLEVDLATGRRSSRTAAVEGLLKELTGAEAALVVNNHAGATMLAFDALAAGREVIVSRGELVELADGFRLPEMIAASGAVLREVGTTNQTRPDDYANAIGPETAALMLVHTSEFALVGNVGSVRLEDLTEVGRKHSIPVIHDVGPGALLAQSEFGLPDEPVVSESLKAGADLVLASGDKLVGGPQSGLILGRRALVEQIGRHPTARAFRVGKLTLAGLAATLRLYRDPKRAQRQIPVLSLLNTSVENLKGRAERLAPQLAATPAVSRAEPIDGVSFLDGGSSPLCRLPTWSIAIRPEGMTADRLAAALSQGVPAVLGRAEEGRLVLDLRTVAPRQDQPLVEAFAALGRKPPEKGAGEKN
ncbi:MAG: L-seryl-tRNA(Sec) selenium transferase [Planctomycetota bacterium]